MVGLASCIEMFSLHAAVFGVGMTFAAGLMPVAVLSKSAVGDGIVPDGGFAGISGIASGKAAALVSAFAGADVHDPPGVELPSEAPEVTVPVELPLIDV
jgi:hypothetical protein